LVRDLGQPGADRADADDAEVGRDVASSLDVPRDQIRSLGCRPAYLRSLT
jgi:hypothetical protein